MKGRIALLALGLALALSVSGCAKLVLQHTPLTPAPSMVGSVSLVVNNARPPDDGADNDRWVGRLRNLWGMAIKLEAKNSLVDATRAMYTDALANAGYQVAEGAPAQVVVDITAFIMDGYMGYKIDSLFVVKAIKDGNEVYRTEIAKSNAFAHMSNSDMYKAYQDHLDQVVVDVVAAFRSPEFQAAIAGSAAPAPVAEPAAAAGQ